MGFIRTPRLSAAEHAEAVGEALVRDRRAMDDIHATMSRPAPSPPRRDHSKTDGVALRAAPSAPPLARLRASSQWPPCDAFILRLRLSQLDFPGGPSALPALFLRAPGGAFGKVVIGRMARTGTLAAVKLLLGRGDRAEARESFLRETENLLRLRTAADAVRLLDERGHPLELADAGASHVAYAYGTGEEADLSALDPALPPGPAFLIAVEPLAETLTERLRRAPGGLLPLRETLRAAREIALGLAFLAKHGVVVSKGRESLSPSSSAHPPLGSTRTSSPTTSCSAAPRATPSYATSASVT